jgi:hypothetical protein
MMLSDMSETRAGDAHDPEVVRIIFELTLIVVRAAC